MKRSFTDYMPAFLCLLILLGAAALGIHSGDELRYLDEREYHELAENILNGRGYINDYGNPTAYRTPGYPLILTGLYRIWHRPLAAKILNALLLTAAAWLLARLAARENRLAGLFPPLLILLYPILLYMSSTLYTQTLAACLLVLTVFMISREGNRLSVPLSGFVFGFLLLVTPSCLMVLPVLMLFLLLRQKTSLRRRWVNTVIFLSCMLVLIVPWTVRNSLLFGRFVFISTNSGENLLYGNSEHATPASGPNTDISRYEKAIEGLNEAERDVYFRNQALTWIRRNPGSAVRLYLLKTLHYFHFRNDLGTGAESSRLRDLLMALTYYPLLILAGVRLIFRRRFPLSQTEWLLYGLYFANAFLSAVFFTRIRFRLPFDTLLIAIVAIFIGHIVTGWKGQEKLAAG